MQSLQDKYNLEAVPPFLSKVPDSCLRNLLTMIIRAGNFAIITRRENLDLNVQTKGMEDFVTEVDISNQNYLVTELLKTNWQEVLNLSHPVRVGFVLEEDTELTKEVRAKGDEDLFVYIDPIDGTTSYKEGEDNFSIGIDIENKDGQTYYAAVYLPVRNEIYIRDRDNPLPYMIDAQGENHKLAVSKEISIKKVAAHYNKEHKKNLLKIYSVLSRRNIKWPNEATSEEERFGDNPIPGSLMMDLCDLASGRYDLVVNGGAHLWDVAPVLPILEKLGYECVNWSGKKIVVKSHKGQDQILTLIAGSPENVRLFFERMKDAGVDLES